MKYHNKCKNINKITLPETLGSHHLACESSFSFTYNVPLHFSDEYLNLLVSRIGGSIIDMHVYLYLDIEAYWCGINVCFRFCNCLVNSI